MSKNAIVIGASSGIGFALTQALLERSFAVGVCSRHLEPLQILQEKFSREQCLVQRMDVTELEEASRTLEALIGQLSDVQLIILNAGVGHLNPDLDFSVWSRCCEIQAGNGQAPVWPPEMILRCLDDGCTSCGEKSKSYGPQSPTVARDLNNLAELLCSTNRMIRCRADCCGIER